MKIDFIDLVQGTDDDDNEFGYAGITDRGGRFFTWLPTVRETIESIHDDETDPPDNWPLEAYRNIRGLIRRNHKRIMLKQANVRLLGRNF